MQEDCLQIGEKELAKENNICYKPPMRLKSHSFILLFSIRYSHSNKGKYTLLVDLSLIFEEYALLYLIVTLQNKDIQMLKICFLH